MSGIRSSTTRRSTDRQSEWGGYDLDGDGDATDAVETSYRTMANDVFTAINEAGDI